MHPERKKIRLDGWSYSTEGAYFLTICTKNRRCLFSHILGCDVFDGPRIQLTKCGTLVQNALIYISEHTQSMVFHNWVIMPNHVHILVSVTKDGMAAKDASGSSRPTEAIIPRFVSSLKRYTNKQSGIDLWQTSYYDHIIRDDEDFARRWHYIDKNPYAWLEDDYYIG